MRVGFAGNVAVSVEELSALLDDLAISSVLVVVAVLLVILLFFGWWAACRCCSCRWRSRRCSPSGWRPCRPFGITGSTRAPRFLGSIIIGNGINFGIIWLARYVEARRRASRVEAALAMALGRAQGTLSAALAAASPTRR